MIWRRGVSRSPMIQLFISMMAIANLAAIGSGFSLEEEVHRVNMLQSKFADKKRMMQDVNKTTPELIRGQGYPVEIHHVTTKDGYILELHRIPHGIRNRRNHTISGKKRPAIFLQHCLLCSSSDWIMNTPDRALAYILADAGYDVWMGNARGNTYSRKHRVLSPDDKLFWDFSWAEMGKYDAPASIDYVLNNTQHERLYYVGYSMGTTIFFTMMNYHPEMNDKIIGMIALAPVAYVTHVKGPLGSMMPYLGFFEAMMSMAGVGEVFPSSKEMNALVTAVCPTTQITSSVCHNLLFALTGPDLEQLNQDYLPVILAHTPAGTSIKTLLHFMQNGRNDGFRQYDYGFFGNFRKYGRPTAPSYDFSKVKAPVAAFYSDNDWLATPKDVKRLLAELPNLVLAHRVKNKNFSHLDFVWALDSRELVLRPVLEALSRFPA